MNKKLPNLFSWFSKPTEEINIIKNQNNLNPNIELIFRDPVSNSPKQFHSSHSL